MKKIFTLSFLLLSFFAKAQLLSWTPSFIQETSTSVVITMNASYGNQGLLNYTPTTDVYVHIGVITNLSTNSGDWRYVPFTWGTTNPAANAKYLGNNQWSFTITGNLRSFFGMTNASEHIQKIAILFRNGSGGLAQRNADASNMYVPVYDNGLYTRIDQPYSQPEYVPIPQPISKNVGDPLAITANASQSGTLKVYFNGALLSSGTGTTVTDNTTITKAGPQQIIATITNGTTVSDTFNFVVSAPNTVASVPSGDSYGINYEAGDTSVTLVLYAPHKNHVYVVGDFNNWAPSAKYQMNVTPNDSAYWITITGLTPQVEYAYQFLIDDSIQVADYSSTKVLDKTVDPQIPSTTYPNLKAFPAKAAGNYAGVLETGQTAYTWHDASFVRPDKRNLVIYELWINDFIAADNYSTLMDSIAYLKRLGINAIELMPVCNFDGGVSWGYNPNFFFAPEKVYGTADALRAFIDAAHQQGMAVIMDLAMQDVTSTSPLAQMYWNSSLGIPAANNPWLDQYQTHAYNVFCQFNHSSSATEYLRYQVYKHWLNYFHFDGFRFDLAGGYTQNNTCDATGGNCNVGTWNEYDQGRVNTWDSIYVHLQAISPGCYTILESFVNDNENQVYVNQGMMVWGGGDINSAATQASMGYSINPSWDMTSGVYSSHTDFTQPGIIDYQESHDETVGGDERIMFKNENYGNSNGAYTIKDTATGLKRAAMTTAIWALMPGPKMMWMFGELGYDYSPDACSNGLLTCSSVDPKPIPWAAYYPNANRQALYSVYSRLFALRNTPAYLATFTNNGNVNNTAYSLSGAIKWISDAGPNLQVVAYGNFDVQQQTGVVTFPSTGTWYNLLNGGTLTINSTSQGVILQPGEYYVYVNNENALPLQWLNFTAQLGSNQTILLNWATGNEINNNYFDVERSADGINFSLIGTVQAGKPDNSVDNYEFTDMHPLNGINYYRLKQVDNNGLYTYSKIVALTIEGSRNLWRVYPNPAHSGTALYAQTNLSKLQLVLTDASGRVLFTNQLESVTTGQRIDLPVQQLAKGVYMLKVSSGKASHTEKIVVE